MSSSDPCDSSFQDPAGIFELIEVVGNGTYGQVYKVCAAAYIIACLFVHLSIKPGIGLY